MAYTAEELQRARDAAKAAGDLETVALLDKELQKGKPTDWKDVAMSGATGWAKSGLNLMAGGLAAKMGMKPSKGQSLVEKMPWHTPQTKAGEYSERMGAGSFGPGPVLGAAGGALSQFAKDQNAGPVMETLAWMTPSVLGGILRSLMKTSAGQQDAARALRTTSPEDVGRARANVAAAAERGVQLPIWQAAPENSPLYRMGRGVAHNPEADNIQTSLMHQSGPASRGQAWIREHAGPAYDAVSGRPVDPNILAEIRNRMAALSFERALDPQHPDMGVIERTMARFENPPQGGIPPQAQGTVLGPHTGAGQPYPPTVRSAGNVMSLAQDMRAPPPKSDFINASPAIRLGLKSAVDEAMAAVPGYTDASRQYGRTADIAEIMTRDAPLRGANVNPMMQAETRTSPGSLAMVGLGTNPWWSIVPLVRERLGKQAARQLDMALASSDFRELERLAGANPHAENAIRVIMQGLRSQGQTPSLNIEDLMRQYSPIPLPGGGSQ